MPAVFAQAPAGGMPDFTDKFLALVGPTQATPLTPKLRFHLFAMNTVGPVPLIGEAIGAGFSQATNSPKEWDGGWDAYGKRYGSNLLYNAVRQTITYGASSAFHEDNRYFASHARGFWPRTRHALVSAFTARSSDGTRSISVSSISGVLGASAIASIWGPASWKGGGNISENAAISFASTAVTSVLQEFVPDIFHRPVK